MDSPWIDPNSSDSLRPALSFALLSIAHFCLECARGETDDAYNCRIKNCPLYTLRTGRVSSQAQVQILKMPPNAPINASIAGTHAVMRLRRLQGICTDCGVNKAMPNSRYCAECQAIRYTANNKRINKRYYEARKASRLCVRCGAPLAPDDGVVCAACNQARRRGISRADTPATV